MAKGNIDIKTVYDRIKGCFDHKYALTNSYIFKWESDYFGMSKSGYVYEIEVKMSKSDFKADFKNKPDKHRQFEQGGREFVIMKGYNRHENMLVKDALELGYELSEWQLKREHASVITGVQILIQKPFVPNRFYFACPEGLIKPEDVPDYAGLLYIGEGGIFEVKPSKFIHKRKMLKEMNHILLDKFYYQAQKLDFVNYELRSSIIKLNNQYQTITDEEAEEQQLELFR